MTLTIVASILGILGTYFAWKYNIKRRLNTELEQVKGSIKTVEDMRDMAIKNKDSIAMTQATVMIVGLLSRKTDLEKRLEAEK